MIQKFASVKLSLYDILRNEQLFNVEHNVKEIKTIKSLQDKLNPSPVLAPLYGEGLITPSTAACDVQVKCAFLE